MLLSKKLHDVLTSAENKKLLDQRGSFQQYEREMNLMTHLIHPYIVRFIGAVVDNEGRPIKIVTELMHRSLKDLLKSTSHIDDKVVITVGLNISNALNYLHTLTPTPIAHRDISPGNILFTVDGVAKLSDCGMAKLNEEQIYDAGTVLYQPKEAISREQKVNPFAIDVYSFGIILLEICHSKLPSKEIWDSSFQKHELLNGIRKNEIGYSGNC